MFSHGVMTALCSSPWSASVYDQAHTRDMTLFGGLVQQDAAVRLLLRRSPASRRSACRASPASSRSSTSSSARSRRTRGPARSASSRRMHHGRLHPAHDVRWRSSVRSTSAGAALKEMTKLERGTASLLLVFILFMGLWPAPFVDRISETVTSSARSDLRVNFDYTLFIPEFMPRRPRCRSSLRSISSCRRCGSRGCRTIAGAGSRSSPASLCPG